MKPFLRSRSLCFLHARDGIAAVEFALVAPLLLLVVGLVVDFGRGIHAQLRLGAALHAAAQYAASNGGSVTPQTAPAFLSTLRGIVSGTVAFPQPPAVDARFNNAASGSNASNFYCVTGYRPVTWASTGTSSASCGGSLMSGKFVSITATASVAYYFLPQAVASRIASVSDTVVMRVR